MLKTYACIYTYMYIYNYIYTYIITCMYIYIYYVYLFYPKTSGRGRWILHGCLVASRHMCDRRGDGPAKQGAGAYASDTGKMRLGKRFAKFGCCQSAIDHVVELITCTGAMGCCLRATLGIHDITLHTLPYVQLNLMSRSRVHTLHMLHA